MKDDVLAKCPILMIHWSTAFWASFAVHLRNHVVFDWSRSNIEVLLSLSGEGLTEPHLLGILAVVAVIDVAPILDDGPDQMPQVDHVIEC